MAYDKLSIINSALTRTGNNPVAVEGDGSPEWIVAGQAYDDELPLLLYDHSWGFASTIVPLDRIGAAADQRWSDAFRRPTEALHVEAVYSAADIPIDYDVLDNNILANATSARAKIIRRPTPESWPEGFVETLRQRIMVHIYRGLNEDPVEATRMAQNAGLALAESRARADQEKPRRARVNSGLVRARYTRKTGYARGSTL